MDKFRLGARLDGNSALVEFQGPGEEVQLEPSPATDELTVQPPAIKEPVTQEPVKQISENVRSVLRACCGDILLRYIGEMTFEPMNTSHWSTGGEPFISQQSKIDSGSYGDVHRVRPLPIHCSSRCTIRRNTR